MGWLFRQKRDIEREFVQRVFVHSDGLFRFALRLSGSETEAEDIVQEALVKAFKAFERLRPGTNHRAWAYAIVRNTFISRVRKSNRLTSLEAPDAVPDRLGHTPETLFFGGGEGYRQGFEDEVLAALSKLAEVQRTAVVLCDIEGLSYDEIAEVLDCPVGTVRSRIHHARRRLRHELSGYAHAKGYGHVEKRG